MDTGSRASLRAMRSRYPARKLPVVDFRQDEGPARPEGAEDCPQCEGTGACQDCGRSGCGECDGTGDCNMCDGDGWMMPG